MVTQSCPPAHIPHQNEHSESRSFNQKNFFGDQNAHLFQFPLRRKPPPATSPPMTHRPIDGLDRRLDGSVGEQQALHGHLQLLPVPHGLMQFGGSPQRRVTPQNKNNNHGIASRQGGHPPGKASTRDGIASRKGGHPRNKNQPGIFLIRVWTRKKACVSVLGLAPFWLL